MSLSDRIRPGAEAAPWVVDEVLDLEQRLAAAVDALAKISLAEADSSTPAADKVRDMGRIARHGIAACRHGI